MIRNIILHCHFFKNAGSTIDWALRRCFPNSFYEHQGELSIPGWNKRLANIILDSKVQVVTSHIFTFPPPQSIILIFTQFQCYAIRSKE